METASGAERPAARLVGGGEMGELIRAMDWSQTAIGPLESWSTSLRMMVNFMLANRFPLLLWWGPDFVSIYNDPYRPVLGAKHPWALGKPVSECWSEIWHILKPLIETPFQGGPATWMEDIELEINRHGFLEETHFTVAYSPVPDESAPRGIGGVLATVHEISDKVVAERRVAALRDLGLRLGEAKSDEEACSIAAAALGAHGKDVPFVLLYLIDADGSTARLVAAAGVAVGADISPLAVSLADPASPWPFAVALLTQAAMVVDRLGERFSAVPRGPWADAPQAAVLAPIPSHKAGAPAGFMIAGFSARLKPDERYRDFFELAKAQIATAISNARAYEEEKKRAESLAELDRAKTTFFSNVSHEFRTPLTLMLGPVDEILAKPEGGVLPENRALLTIAQRNGQRLLKLVNTLLDFARIEAGRAQARFEPTDLGRLTADLASIFRSACERVGLSLEVDCPPGLSPACVDRDMWEKIVLNLLSNAFKFTFEGGISVKVREQSHALGVTVTDTGTGIPEEALTRIFDRFQRVEGARGRSHEGSGIGLALVHELVKLHGGSIEVASTPGKGSAFTVWLPTGDAHLPKAMAKSREGLAPTLTRADAYVSEALSWLPGDETNAAAAPAASGQRVLLADDNADLREYVRRLLSEHYQVETVGDGEAALAAARARRPDIVVTDVMMPGLDGFGLIRELRSDSALSSVPIVLLSARAGEEARLEGIEKGADAYLVKPFSARQLLVRVAGLLQSAEARQRADTAVRQRVEALRDADRRKDEFLATLSHELRNPLAPIRNAVTLLRDAADDPAVRQKALDILERQVGHTIRLVDDLLDVARITQGTISLDRRSVSLQEVVDAALEISRPHIERARHRLSVSLPRETIVLGADPVRLAQVVANVLNNAAKFTPAEGRISLEARRADGEALIAVRDSGRGIPHDMLDKVFDMFSRGGGVWQRDGGGLGIGLSLSRRLMQLHGGSIEARSEGPGRGSEFTIRLPIPPEAQPARPARAALAASTAARRVLVVDDNVDAAQMLSILLRNMGHDVEVVHDGEAALTAAANAAPDVVLLDLGLPRMDGYGVAAQLRKDVRLKDTRVIALTGFGTERDRARSRDSGFDQHLVKPVDPEALRSALEGPWAGG